LTFTLNLIVIYACYAISLLMATGAYRVVTSCTQAELTHSRLLTAKFSLNMPWFFQFLRNFYTGLSPTESRLRNKCESFSAIMWDIWVPETDNRHGGTRQNHLRLLAYYMTQHEGGRHNYIDFRQKRLYLRGRLRL